MIKKYKFLLTTVDGCVVSFILLSIVCVVILYLSMKIGEKWALRPITEQTGIDSWEELDNYVKETFVRGMPRDKVYEELDKFGDYQIRPTGGTKDTFCEMVGLPTGNPVNFTNLRYLTCYSLENDTLTEWTLHD